MKILIAADFCPMERVASLIDSGNFEDVFGEIKPLVKDIDYSIVNFECPVCTKEGVSIKKAGPSLKCSAKAIEAIKYVGFDCVTLANNHFFDQGDAGVEETIEALKKNNIDYVGGGYNIEEASKIFYHAIGDKTIAIINCCEHEWSIATEQTGGSNPLNPIQQYYDIIEAKKKADFVIVIVHGGIEHFQYPSPRMVETYRFFVDAGADAVINHHQHCFSGAELYKNKPIFYGLGNFCFDEKESQSKLWEEGYMVQLDLNDCDCGTKVIPYIQNSANPGVHLKKDKEKEEWMDRFNQISVDLQNESKLKQIYDKMLKRTHKLYSIKVTPYTNHILMSLYIRGLLPKIMSKEKLRFLLNSIMCESHRDRLINMLKDEVKS